MILNITVGAYVLSPEVKAAIETVEGDRLFLRSTFSINDGNIQNAIADYANSKTPDLLIVQTSSQGEALYQELNSLANVCDADTRVMLVGVQNDVNLFKELIDQGISQYFVETVGDEELRNAIFETFATRSEGDKCRMIAVTGVRGGVGASVIAHNMAYELSNLGEKTDVILIDLDIPFGTASLSFNLQPQSTIVDVIAQITRLDETLLERLMESPANNLSLLAAPGSLSTGITISTQALEPILNIAKQLAAYVVIDLPHTWATWSQDLLIDADEVVLVANPDLYNLRDSKNIFEFLNPNRGIEAPTRMVLNRTDMNKKSEISAKEFKETIGQDVAVSIPFDADSFAAAMNNGQMISTISKRSKATEAIQSLARTVSGDLDAKKETPEKSNSLFGFLAKK